MVILGYRYSGYTLADVRIHDINLVADLNAHDPMAPAPPQGEEYEQVPFDGTSRGIKPCASAVSFIDLLVAALTASASSWWTGWWPVLHTRTTGNLPSGAIFAYQIACDLLGSSSVEEMIVDTPLDDHLSDGDIKILAQTGVGDFLAAAIPAEALWFLGAQVLMGAIDILLLKITKLPTGFELGVLFALIAAYSFVMLGAFYSVWDGIQTGRLTPAVAFGILLVTVVATMIIEGTLALINAFRIYAEWWNHYKQASLITKARRFVFFSVFIVAIKILITAIAFILMMQCYEYWLAGY